MAESTYDVYAIRNRINGRLYIGCTECAAYRWQQHLWLLRKWRHTSAQLQHDWIEFGEDAFEHMIIRTCPSQHSALLFESMLIRKTGAYYNTLHRPKYAEEVPLTEEMIANAFLVAVGQSSAA